MMEKKGSDVEENAATPLVRTLKSTYNYWHTKMSLGILSSALIEDITVADVY